MGKGDQKSKKGKISSGSYGVTRKRKKAATYVAKPKAKKAEPAKEEAPAKETVKKAPAKKPAAKKAPVKK